MTTMKNPNQKGGSIEGGLVSEEFLASSKSVLDKSQFGEKGAQQFYTPHIVSRLAAAVFGNRLAVFDPTAGDGSLLHAFDPANSFGVEIDPDQVEAAAGSYRAVRGDIQHVFPLIKLGMQAWEAIVANPPFGLQWQDATINSGKPTNSAMMTWEYLHRLLSDTGQYMFIDGKNHFESKIMDTDHARGVYAIIDVPEMFPGTSHPAVIAFGVSNAQRSESFAGAERREVPLEMVDLLGDWVKEARRSALGSYGHLSTSTYASYRFVDEFAGIQREYDKRADGRFKKDREFDCLLVGGKVIQWLPSAFALLALSKAGERYAFDGLNKANVTYFAGNERLWVKMLGFHESGVLTVDPKLIEAVEAVVGDVRKEMIPLYNVTLAQRLGFLDDIDLIKCIKSDPESGFIEGESYRLDTDTKPLVRTEKRPVEIKSGKNQGDIVMKEFRIQYKAMQIRIGKKTFYDSGTDSSEQIAYIIDHFELPDPGEISSRFPNEIRELENVVRNIYTDTFAPNSAKWEAANPSTFPFSTRDFQIEDIARLLFKRRGLLSWEQGLGKMLGGIAFIQAAFQLDADELALIIVPGDLVKQWQREIKRFTGQEATLIKSHGQCHKLRKDAKRGLAKGIYIAHYEMLTQVGTRGKKGNQALPAVAVYEKTEMKQVKGTGRYGYFWAETEADPENPGQTVFKLDAEGRRITHLCTGPYDPEIPEGVKAQYGYVPEQFVPHTKTITSKEVCPECRADWKNGWNGMFCEAKDDKGQTCGYAHYAQKVKPMASLLSTAFKNGVVVMDEITLMQGDTSQRSRALRGLKARYRLGMTGTPIKNYIRQAFWLLWWCIGNGSKRFGYDYEGGYTRFESDFSVIEWQMSGGKKETRKALPEVTNLSRFWRLIASSTIRRRKEETGEVIVPRFDYEITVPLGTAQRTQMHKWLKDFPKLFAEKYPDSKVVKAGMHEIMAPMLGLQQKLDYACTIPLADPDHEWTGIEVSNWTPATLKTLELVMALAKRGRKVLVGSNLIATSQFIADSLAEKGVKAIHILDDDGKTANKEERAVRVYSFQTDDVQAFCAGVKAIRLGHNLDAADAVVLHGVDWDRETLDQFVNRVHRLTSRNPIDVFVVLPDSGENAKAPTFTQKKWDILGQKGQSIELALDGRLIEKHETKIDQSQIVRDLMEMGIQATGDEIDEEEIEEAWRNMPMFDNYVEPETLIPPPPIEITDEGRAAAEAIGMFFMKGSGLLDVERLIAEVEGMVADVTMSADLVPLADWDELFGDFNPQVEIDETEFNPELEAGVPDEFVLAQNAVELAEQADAVAVAEEVAVDPLVAIQEQLAALVAQNAELAAEVARLKSDEQLSLFGDAS